MTIRCAVQCDLGDVPRRSRSAPSCRNAWSVTSLYDLVIGFFLEAGEYIAMASHCLAFLLIQQA